MTELAAYAAKFHVTPEKKEMEEQKGTALRHSVIEFPCSSSDQQHSSIDRSVTDSRPFILALGNSSLFIILGLLPPMAQTQTEGGPLQSTFSSNHAASSSMTENKPSKLPVSKARHSLCSRPHNGPETPDPLVQRKSALM